MTSDDLVAGIHAATGIDHGAVRAVLAALAAAVQATVAAGDLMELPGIGTLQGVRVDARVVRHPRTGKPIAVPSQIRPRFTPAIDLDEALYPGRAAAIRARERARYQAKTRAAAGIGEGAPTGAVPGAVGES